MRPLVQEPPPKGLRTNAQIAALTTQTTLSPCHRLTTKLEAQGQLQAVVCMTSTQQTEMRLQIAWTQYSRSNECMCYGSRYACAIASPTTGGSRNMVVLAVRFASAKNQLKSIDLAHSTRDQTSRFRYGTV